MFLFSFDPIISKISLNKTKLIERYGLFYLKETNKMVDFYIEYLDRQLVFGFLHEV